MACLVDWGCLAADPGWDGDGTVMVKQTRSELGPGPAMWAPRTHRAQGILWESGGPGDAQASLPPFMMDRYPPHSTEPRPVPRSRANLCSGMATSVVSSGVDSGCLLLG